MLLALICVAISAQHITKKAYNSNTANAPFTFAFLSVLTAAAVSLAASGGAAEVTPAVLGYAAAFAIFYSLAAVTALVAIKNGPLSLTSLITAMSLIVPTLYGIITLGEPITTRLVFGLILLVLCLVCINLRRGEKKITIRWAVSVALAFLGNGICSTVQKAQQLRFGGDYKSEFVALSLMISAAILLIFVLVFERGVFLKSAKSGFMAYTLCGIANAAANLIIMAISLSVAASVMFPVMSAGSIAITTLVSVVIFRERLSFSQWLGLAFGILAIIFIAI